MIFNVKYLDGTTESCNVTHTDRLVAEQNGYRRGWPSIQEAQMSYLTLQCFYALKRMLAAGKTDHEIPADFNDWTELIDDIELDRTATEPDDSFTPAAQQAEA